MSTYIIYKQLIGVYQRLGRNTTELALRIDTAYAMGRMTEEEYAELILSVTPAAE
ncbi:MAG: hypothetical protein VB064_04790 [Oscillospiraceae bacterium]|nr:hypothetical protein [Oscillospiraceae bacterium]